MTQTTLDVAALIEPALLGIAIGDALGVPVEFQPRQVRDQDPVTEMRGYGTWNQPPGTWSDDSALCFCLVESLCLGSIDTEDIARRFVAWMNTGYWSAHGVAFDIGGTTRKALVAYQSGTNSASIGGSLETDNGNGSLMRILPLAFLPIDEVEMFNAARRVSGITHSHPRSVLGCYLLVAFAKMLLSSEKLPEAYVRLRDVCKASIELGMPSGEIEKFTQILNKTFTPNHRDQIRSTGYVLDTFEAVLFCLLTTSDFESAVLTAVNLGDDTDTTAAITGGLAGILYPSQLPDRWLQVLSRRQDISDLAARFDRYLRKV
jgi:ADP-ribosyl-[dinitrogen reductase] hydrolase